MILHITICRPKGVWAPDSTALDVKLREPPGQQAEWAGEPPGRLASAAGRAGQWAEQAGGPNGPVGRAGRRNHKKRKELTLVS
jgi:hypothetical protein